MARILSIQSQVVFGHVGNSAAALPLQMLGHEVWPVPTAILSNHAGYLENGGAVLDSTLVDDLLDGLAARGVPGACDLVLTGYLGAYDIASAVLDRIDALRAVDGELLYACDPVMGDRETGLYVPEDLAALFRARAVPAADILTPNLFELAWLADEPHATDGRVPAEELVALARKLIGRMRPGGVVLATSFEHAGLAADTVAVAAITADATWLIETPRLKFTRNPHGAGDLLAALFAAGLVETRQVKDAVEDAVARLFAVLAATAGRDGQELELVRSRSDFLAPARRFEAMPLA